MNKATTKAAATEPLTKSSNQFPVVGVGASAGGLEAFKKLLHAIPENSGMAYVLVQHLDPTHESLLPELLQKVTAIPVVQIVDEVKIVSDHIYIIPSNKMLIANDGVLQLSPRTTNKNERNLPIDLFFASLAEIHQSHSIGVVLSGTASDGTLGLKAIKDHGGITFAQDEASAAYKGMPHSAAEAGVVDFILPPEQIPQKLLEVTRILNNNGDSGSEETTPKTVEEVFKQILSLLRIRKGTDFTHYKQTTIRRRILRRMALNKNEEPAAYLKFLREHKPEQDALYQDLLIPVTSFFRDAKSFDNLCETVFPRLIKYKQAGEPIRVWVVGCSTGQEVYSIAICLKEYLGDYQERVQLFATDLSEPAIAKARQGVYTKIEAEGISEKRLQEFFTKTNGSYQVNKSIRDMCVFALHNFLKDPPFGKMDFISCRNVLIYMEPYLQNKALTTFHYALNQEGFLLLGKSETISSVPELFASAAKGDKLFSRKDVPAKFMITTTQRSERNLRQSSVSTGIPRTDFQKTADDILLSQYTPAGVVVNEATDIVHFRGKTNDYLEQPQGKPTASLFRMAKQGLAFELRNILHKAKKDKATVIKENIPVQINGDLRNISIEAIPLPNTIEPYFLILFHEKQLVVDHKKTTSRKLKKDDKDLRIQQLELELAQIREDIRTITEDQEAANEELQGTNEELLSGSEELQSLNEELETGKEELQSTNEELTIVNHEMISLNEQVTEARNYAEAIITTIREPLLVLDKSLRIKSANSAFYKTFQVNELETEGRLIYNLGDNQWNIPKLRTLLEDILPKEDLFADYEVTHNFPNIGERVMLLNASEITRDKTEEKLILLAIEDVTGGRKRQQKERELLAKFENLVLHAPVAIMVLKGKDYVVEVANDTYLQIVEKEKDFVGKPLFDSLPELKTQGITELLDAVMRTGVPHYGDELEVHMLRNKKKAQGFYNFTYHPTKEDDGTVSGIIVVANEVTEQVLSRRKVEESERHFRHIADLMPAKISNANAAGDVTYFNEQWIEFSGCSFEELKDFGYHKMLHPDELEEFQKRLQHAGETGTVLEMEMRFRNKKGEYIWHLNLASPIKDEDGNIKMWVGVTTDIQTQKAQRKLLEEAVLERTDELQKSNEELLRSNKELEAFTYISSHDLQEPLRKIRTFAGLILEKEDQNLSDNGKGLFKRMQDASERMQALIQDLLAFSRLGAAERKFENTDLNAIIEQVIEEFGETITGKHAIIEVKEVGEVKIIPFQFRQLMQNLIGNALKFSNPEIPPHITIECHPIKYGKANEHTIPPNKEYCHITVTDNGIGFEEEYSEKIFEVFQKLHGKEEYAGTGIGLAIVKKIVENHHGIITATSELGKGARFDIHIPA